MNKACLRISLAVAVLLACRQLCFAVPPNGPAPSGGTESSPAQAASSYPDSPSAVKTPGTPDNSAEKSRFQRAAPAAAGGLNRALDGKYAVVMSAMFASSIVNVEKTNTCLEQHTCSFVPVAFRSRMALYGAGIPMEAGIAYLGYRLKEQRHRWWFVPALAVTAANAYVAYHSAHEPSSPRTTE